MRGRWQRPVWADTSGQLATAAQPSGHRIQADLDLSDWSSAIEALGMAAGFLASPDGPRIAMIKTRGRDTHTGQNTRLARRLKGLDGLIPRQHEGLGETRAQTVILVATEFGRTAAANGTGGGDHGIAAATVMVGGCGQGEPVVVDWPGLSPASLFEGRDLEPTLALGVLIATVCSEAFQVEPERNARIIFLPATRGTSLPRLLRLHSAVRPAALLSPAALCKRRRATFRRAEDDRRLPWGTW